MTFASVVYVSFSACCIFQLMIRATALKARRPIWPRNLSMNQECGKVTRVGFVGLGIMGDGMSRCLLRGQVPLLVWNRSKEKSQKLKDEFPDLVTIAESPKAVTSQTDLSVVMLSTPEASRSVYSGDDGLLAGLDNGKYVIDCATLTPADMVWMHDAVTKKGSHFVEAPVSGSKMQAEKGQLIFMTAGDEVLATNLGKKYFDLMGKSNFYLGSSVGAATKMKLVVNSMMGNIMSVLSEGLHLTEACGLSQSTLLEIVSQGAIGSPMISIKGPKMIQGQHDPNFPLKHARKDIVFAVDLAKTLGVEATMSETSVALFDKAMARGLGDEDFSAVFEVDHKAAP